MLSKIPLGAVFHVMIDSFIDFKPVKLETAEKDVSFCWVLVCILGFPLLLPGNSKKRTEAALE